MEGSKRRGIGRNIAQPDRPSIVVVGAGVFGVTAAIELKRRGSRVRLVDPGPLPHPDAASTDVSKAVRMDYGSDELYAELGERAIEGWHEWNGRWDRPLYHEVGFLLMTRGSMSDNPYERRGFELLLRRGHAPERMDRATLTRRYPAWDAKGYADGYYNPCGGWAESGEVMSRLVESARAHGVELHRGTFAGLELEGGRVTGIATADHAILSADLVLVAAGAWTPNLLPELRDVMWATGQPVLHFKPDDPRPYESSRFPVWGADISKSGWYGFPVNGQGLLKVANHGPGSRVDPAEPRVVDPDAEGRFREFLASTFPGVARAPLAGGRLCLYCDTWDGNFWIDQDPRRRGLFVAAGGSGHAFKFAPLLGPIVADVIDGKPSACAERFAWRRRGELSTEQARGDTPLFRPD